MDKVRFVNSGTEAVLSAIRLARGFTKRNKIIKFAGCYHGHTDALLVAAGSGLVTAGLPGSAGVPEEAVKNTLVALFNDIDSVKTLFNQFPEEIAGVIIEPVAGNMGVIVPENNFLKDLEMLCHKNGALLILDEVMTGFRSKFGGAQDSFDVTGDITCMGKVIGGGLPVGAYGGKAQIMDCLAPLGDVYQAGTLSGNPIAMTAGIETLKVLRDTNPYQNLEATAIEIEDALFHAAKAKGIALTTNRFGSMINPFFTQGPVSNFRQAQRCDTEQFAKFFWGLMDNGMYIPPSQYEAWFLNNALSPQDLDKACEAITKAIQNL
jgi:glutamate-1-semialdehyde 2,1-aminomutase